ncbi:MAG: FliI/YscN family ATPase, partial [Candidatus Hydrogenedentota bacterium]
MRTLLERYTREIASIDTAPVHGKVETVSGLTIEATARGLHVGDLCYIRTREGRRAPVEVVGFRAGRITLMPLTELNGLAPGQWVYPVHAPLTVKVSLALVGRVIDGLGRPIDGGPPIPGGDPVPLTAAAPRPMERRRVTEAISTGIRAIDGCLTIGRGQRVGIMSGSGVGKSKLLGMIARNTNADVNVIALIGERGKEVRDFVDADLGEEGRKRSVVVAATSDEPALVRIKGAHLATAIAEWFRAQGKNVLLMMDSVTRFSMAQREVGLAAGEPPTTKGYSPSVFALLPKLLERAGDSHAVSLHAG